MRKIPFFLLLFLASCVDKDMSTIDKIATTQENKELSTDTDTDSDENLSEEQKITRTLLNGVLRGEKEIDITEFNIPEDKAKEIFTHFLNDNPLLFHLRMGRNIGYKTQIEAGKTNLIKCFIPSYVLTTSYIKEVYPKLEKKIEEYYSHLDRRMKDEEIAYEMQRLICQNTIYGQNIQGENYEAYNAFSALGPFMNNKAVCQGYSFSFALLMNSLGITTDWVTGAYAGTSGHMWNRILIDNQWYNVDLTFDDANQLKVSKEGSKDRHFLSSDKLFYQKLEHPAPHNNMRERIFTPSGNQFDSPNCAFRWYDSEKGEIRTEPQYVNGAWYYLSFEKEKTQIVKSDFKGEHKQVLRENNISSTVLGNVRSVYYGKDRIYFVDLIGSKYYICSIDYEGNNFKQGSKGYDYFSTTSNDWFHTEDTSKPENDFSGVVALRAEFALAKMRDAYSHGQEDYFKPQDPTRIELRKAIKTAEDFLKSGSKDDSTANTIRTKLKQMRLNSHLPVSAQ